MAIPKITKIANQMIHSVSRADKRTTIDDPRIRRNRLRLKDKPNKAMLIQMATVNMRTPTATDARNVHGFPLPMHLGQYNAERALLPGECLRQNVLILNREPAKWRLAS